MSMEKTPQKGLGQFRDTVESIYIAIILAFVLRAFLVEAFVIPTGSMANSLYGEHYVLTCPCCGQQYAHGSAPERRVTGTRPPQAHCPNCTYQYADSQKSPEVFSRGGDRVLVLKYLYNFSPPKPWDVVVFKNPQNNRENFIKRLIGLPGETIEIVHGDIFVKGPDSQKFRIRRKDSVAQKAMWLIVYDNDYPPDPILVKEEGLNPPRWEKGRGGVHWEMDLKPYGRRVFEYKGAGPLAELRFDPGENNFRPYNSYNALEADSRSMHGDMDICTDWILSCVLKPIEPGDSQVNLTFECFGDRFRAEFNTSGAIRLLHQPRGKPSDKWAEWGKADVGSFVAGEGREIAFSNVDYRAKLWVDGKIVLASNDKHYPGDYKKAIQRVTIPRQRREIDQRIEDIQSQLSSQSLSPAKKQKLQEQLSADIDKQRHLITQWGWYQKPGAFISARGGKLQLSHIKLKRDVYYTCPRLDIRNLDASANPMYDYPREMWEMWKSNHQVPNSWKRDSRGDYLAWGTTGNPIKLRSFPANHDLDEYFCMGDNSAQSNDGRTWIAAAPSLRLKDKNGKFQYQLGTVPRYNIIGRAVLVYWPAGFPLPVLHWPIVPDVGRIRLIR
ncbi:MAG: signal peptidase I [Phycisphaerae bacterium]|nr:signal peptidase I [Phycisphaerae bacterium]